MDLGLSQTIEQLGQRFLNHPVDGAFGVIEEGFRLLVGFYAGEVEVEVVGGDLPDYF